MRQLELPELELEVHRLRDAQRVGERLRQLAEELVHLGGRLEVELIRPVAHPPRRIHRLPGLDAEEEVVRLGVVALEVVTVVGADERDAGLARDFQEPLVHLPLGGDPVVLELEEEVSLAEDVAIADGGGRGSGQIAAEDVVRHLALQACRERGRSLPHARRGDRDPSAACSRSPRGRPSRRAASGSDSPRDCGRGGSDGRSGSRDRRPSHGRSASRVRRRLRCRRSASPRRRASSRRTRPRRRGCRDR